MLTRFRANVSRWPRVFAALVILTILSLTVSYGLCRYIGNQTVNASLLLVGAFVVLCASADGILYSIFAPTHAFSVASLLDRVEGRNDATVSDEESNLEEEESDSEYEEYEEEDETDEESDETNL